MTVDRHLLIDLGGTNTRVAWGDARAVLTDTVRSFLNRDYTDLGAVLSDFLIDQPGDVHGLCAGVAGPVQGNRAQLTNYAWFLDGDALQSQTGARHVALINDLQAQGYALDDIPHSAIQPVKPGAQRDGPRLLLNLGTGCNCAVVHRTGDQLFVPAAESGHSALPQSDGDLGTLFDHLRSDHPHLPIEAVLSGPGLTRVHAHSSGLTLPPEAVMTAIAGGTAPQTLSLFLRTLGTVAGNLALHHLPMGGIYLSGGLAQAMAPYLDAPDFLEQFTARGPYTDIVSAIPIHVITAPAFALHGCHRYIKQWLK